MNVYSILKQAQCKWGKRLCLWSSSRQVTFEELFHLVNGLAGRLQKEGFKPQDKLVIWSPNSLAAGVAILAAWSLEGVVVPLDISAKPQDVAGLIKHAGVKWVFASQTKSESLKETFEITGPLKVFSEQEVFDNLTDDFIPPLHNEQNTAIILYTSGSTGTPKGVVLTYHHLDSPVLTLKHFDYLNEQDHLLAIAPLSHLAGIVGLLIPVYFGTSTYLMERFMPKLFLKYLAQHQITFSFVPPVVLQSLLLQPEVNPDWLKSVKVIASFGAPCPPSVFKAFHEKFPWIYLITGYGLSESAAPNVLIPKGIPFEKRLQPGIVGKPAPWVKVKIVDEKGQELPPGQIGEVLLKGWFVMEGYYNAPELTKEVIKDGWLYTGDLGYLDNEGFLYLTGRKKEVIIVGGLNVYANEVEFVIASHPDVAEVAVVGSPDGIRGEVVKAIIVPKPQRHLTPHDILNHCRQYLANYKLPKIIEFREKLPRTASGKIAKALLK